MTADALPLWPIARAGEALAALAMAAGLAPRARTMGEAPSEARALAAWLDEAGAWLGIEVEAVTASYGTIDHALAAAVPALVHVPATGERPAGMIAVLGASRHRLVAIGLDLRPVTVAVADVSAALCHAGRAKHADAVDAVLTRAGVAGRAKTRAAEAMIAARIRARPVEGIHLLRRAPEAPLAAHAHDRKLVRRVSGVLVLHAISQLLWLGSWWAIGRTILGGTISSAWLAAWGLLLVSSQAARIAVSWSSGHVAIDAGTVLSQRLLTGALRSDPDQLRRDGVGVALGRVLESSAVHQLAVTGGLQAVLSVVELVFAAIVLGLGAGGVLHVILLVIAIGITAVIGRRYLIARRAWTRQRLDLTHALAEAMVGHATRLAQGDRETLADQDDRALVRYLGAARTADRALVWLGVLVPRGWQLAAALALAPVLLLGAPTPAAFAIAVGGILFATQAIVRLADGGARIADALIAWESVAELAAAASAAPDAAPPSLALAPPSVAAHALVARGLSYRHARRGAPVLSGCELVVARGDRILLEGQSGAGKSTLVAILAGLRRPDAGLVLAGGLDRASVGARGWRRRVACAPQFHDNHVFGATLAFNLLMGRTWPPTAADLADATAVCRDLGLGELIERMPGGLFQQVGEIGWQLSHGERSRVFLARALLQGADLVMLDESLAALDPENLAIAIRCIEARAPTAIVIAHP